MIDIDKAEAHLRGLPRQDYQAILRHLTAGIAAQFQHEPPAVARAAVVELLTAANHALEREKHHAALALLCAVKQIKEQARLTPTESDDLNQALLSVAQDDPLTASFLCGFCLSTLQPGPNP